MAAISLFWNTKMAAVTSDENALLHGNLSIQMSNDIKRIQKRALKINNLSRMWIWQYPEKSQEKMLPAQRRCFFGKMINFAHKMHDLLLPRLEDLHYYRSTRSNCNQIYNYKFKTERFRNSPIVYAISKFNSASVCN